MNRHVLALPVALALALATLSATSQEPAPDAELLRAIDRLIAETLNALKIDVLLNVHALYVICREVLTVPRLGAEAYLSCRAGPAWWACAANPVPCRGIFLCPAM